MVRERILKKEGFTLVEIMTVICILCILAAIAIFNYSTPKKQAYDVVAQEDLRRAYTSAIAYFIDHPNGFLTHSSLARYGFSPSPKVILSILDGRPSNLVLISRYHAPGTQAYITFSEGVNSSGASGPSGQPGLTPVQEWKLENSQIGPHPQWVPAEPESPQNPESFARFLQKCDLVAKMKLGEAHAAAEAFFQSHPQDLLTAEQLIAQGFSPHDKVNMTIVDGSFSTFSLSAVFDVPGATSFILGPSGQIAPIS